MHTIICIIITAYYAKPLSHARKLAGFNCPWMSVLVSCFTHLPSPPPPPGSLRRVHYVCYLYKLSKIINLCLSIKRITRAMKMMKRGSRRRTTNTRITMKMLGMIMVIS